MAEIDLFVQIEDASGNVLGSGPLTSVSRWRYTSRMDRAGVFSFTMLPTDPQAQHVQNKRIARAFALLDDAWVEVGAGIIDDVTEAPGPDGLGMLRVRGDDLTRELSYRTVSTLAVGEGSGATHSEAVTAVGDLAPSGWEFTAADSPENDFIYAQFGGESVLGAFIEIADRTRTHFFRGDGRSLVFADSFTDSGIRAIQADGDLAPETCAITRLRRTVTTYDLLTRIYPFGSGQGRARLTLAATSRSAPAGYTLNASENYIEHDAAKTEFGLIDFPQVEFKEITPISNTDADLQAAANMLFDAAVEELTRRATLGDQATYEISLAQCSQLLRPMQTVRAIYRDPDEGIDIDEDLQILEATWEVDETGVQTTGVVVSTDDRWPQTDSTVAADRAAEGRVFQAHPQMNATERTIAYTKNVDADETAAFRFRFGNAVVTTEQVLFEFQLLPFESTVKSIGTETGGAEIETGGPSSDETGSGNLTETGSGGSGQTGSAGDDDTGSGGGAATGSEAPDTGSKAPNTGSKAPNTGSKAPNTGTAAPDTGSGGSSETGLGGGGDTGNNSAETGERILQTQEESLETDGPVGGDIDGSGNHGHNVLVQTASGNLGNVELHDLGSGNYEFRNSTLGSVVGVNAAITGAGNHTHDVDSHTHSVGGHTHGVNNHSHTVSSHSHTTASHTHTVGSHTHTTAAHTHTTASHTHTTASHTHTTASHTHTTASHSHTTAAHTHTTAAHTHDLSGHTHDLSDHTHDLSEGLEQVYGIFRDTAANTFDLDELEYRVNSGSWQDLDANVTDAGDGWQQLDVSSEVIDSTTFRPQQANNLIEIRSSYTPVNIGLIEAFGGGGVIVTTSSAHGLEVGDPVSISDTSLYDGNYTVDSVEGSMQFVLDITNEGTDSSGGTVDLNKRATIDAQLSIRSTIQALAYT